MQATVHLVCVPPGGFGKRLVWQYARHYDWALGEAALSKGGVYNYAIAHAASRVRVSAAAHLCVHMLAYAAYRGDLNKLSHCLASTKVLWGHLSDPDHT